ncbi:MAG: hypothetical protein U0791_09820 [Gemmataceae bacterium]
MGRNCDCPFFDRTPGGCNNFWGYNPIAFAAPKAALAASAKNHGQVAEFRDMVIERSTPTTW